MNDLLSRMLLRVTQPSPVEPVLPSRYERAGAFESGAPFEAVESESEAGIESHAMTGRRTGQEEVDAFAVPARKSTQRRSAEIEEGEESSRAAALRDIGETQRRKSLEERVNRPETERRAAEVVRHEGPLPVREPRVPSVREVRIERERVAAFPENAWSRPLSPTRELAQEAARSTEVHVTIGHIEVRAAAAPAKAPARKAAPPSVSLQEYLARRNGGSR